MSARVALVSGAARGIGRACAQALAADGAQVMAADVNGDGARETAELIGVGARAYVCDFSSPEQIDALFAEVERDVGSVSVLVNNAGVASPADFLETSWKISNA